MDVRQFPTNPIHHDLLMIQFDNKVTNATLVHYAALQMQFRDNLVILHLHSGLNFYSFFIFPDSSHAKNVLIRNTEQDKAADLRLVTPKTFKFRSGIFYFPSFGGIQSQINCPDSSSVL